MPPKAASNASTKTYSADVVAALLVATGTTSLSMKNYELMSSMDGTKTAAAFQHDFRVVLAKAKDLKMRIDNGESFEPVQSSAKRGTTTATPTTPASGKKRKGDGADDTPSKKPKAAAKPRGKKAQSTPIAQPTLEDEDDDDLPADMEDFIKAEKKWEEENNF